jgi:hypothetical protein
MKVTVKMDKVALGKIKAAQIQAFRATATKIKGEKIDSQEIPFNKGTLQNVYTDIDDTAATKGQIVISSKGPYAQRLYYNPQFNFNHEFNANAKGEWWEDWLTGKNKDRANKIFEYFYKKYSGGVVK